MSTGEVKKLDPTKGDYWAGSILSFDTYWWLAVLPTGFFGIDHLALRSPSTAWKKFLVNLFFFGIWYFYDIVQAVGDKTNIGLFGLSSPFGASGIGYKLFKDLPNDVKGTTVPPSPNATPMNTFFYILSMLFLIIPFGFSELFAGDIMGGIVRLASCIFVITIPIYLIYGVMDAWNMCEDPAAIFEKGILRRQPMEIILGTNFYPPTNIVSTAKAKPLQDKYNEEMASQTLVGRITGVASSLAMSALSFVGGPIKTTVTQACKVAGTVGQAGEAAGQIAQSGPALAAAVSQPIPSAPPLVEPIVMKGGAILPSLGDGMLLSGILFLILGGLGITLLRKMIDSKKRDGEDKRDDKPPQAGTV